MVNEDNKTLAMIRLMRLDRPVGALLLLLPILWGITATGLPTDDPLATWRLLFLFTVGAFAARSAGCCWNDWLDRNFDRQIARTRDRPLASGVLTTLDALRVTVLCLLLCLGVISLLPMFALVGVALLAPLAIIYPLVKRYSYFPQVVLGMAFNGGIFVGAFATASPVPWLALIPLYISGVAWTLIYDSVYALPDSKQDRLLGLRSLTHLISDRLPLLLIGFAVIQTAGLWLSQMLLLTLASGSTKALTSGLTLLVLVAQTVLIIRLDSEKPQACERFFHHQVWIGVLTLFILLVTSGLTAG